MHNFTYNISNTNNIRNALSEERLVRYLSLTNNDIQLALNLHLKNAYWGGLLHTPIQHFELLFRNSLNRELVKSFEPEWYDYLEPVLEIRMQKTVDAAKSELKKMHRPICLSGVVPQLTFGFWLSLLTRKYDTVLWRTALYQAFPNAPRPLLRSIIHSNIAKVKDLRNRIVHHEPIFERHLEKDHKLLVEVASWMCVDTAAWIQHHSRFPQIE